MTYHPLHGCGCGHVTVLKFAMVQRVARVRQRQLSYLCKQYTLPQVQQLMQLCVFICKLCIGKQRCANCCE